MLAEMDESLFQRWLKFWAEEPFGPQVENMMLARVAAAASWSEDYGPFLPITVSDSEGDESDG